MSVMATGGGLVFGGDVNGRFRALDQETGAVPSEINLGSPVVGFPITYAVDGRQYIAVNTGAGGGIKPPDDPGAAPQRRQRAVRVRVSGGVRQQEATPSRRSSIPSTRAAVHARIDCLDAEQVARVGSDGAWTRSRPAPTTPR